jgi:hypothetical protein
MARGTFPLGAGGRAVRASPGEGAKERLLQLTGSGAE